MYYIYLEVALDMAYAKPSDVHQLKNELRSCTILAAEPLDGTEEAEVELRRPPEPGVLGPDVGAHRCRRCREISGLSILIIMMMASSFLHRAAAYIIVAR